MSVYTARLARNHTRMRTRRGYPLLVLTGFVLLALLMVAPFGLVAMNAVKTSTDYAAHGPLALPHGLSLDNLKTFWNLVDFGQALLNSALIRGAVAILAVLLSILNAYALGIGRVRGRTWILVAFLIANLLPQEGLVYSPYYLAKQVGLYDTRTAVIIMFTVIQSALGTYLLSSVLGAFPREILEAARIDGAGTWRILWRVVVPVSRPTLTVLLNLLLHLDLERVPAPPGLPGLQPEPDRPRRPSASRKANASSMSRCRPPPDCSASCPPSPSSSSSSARSPAASPSARSSETSKCLGGRYRTVGGRSAAVRTRPLARPITGRSARSRARLWTSRGGREPWPLSRTNRNAPALPPSRPSSKTPSCTESLQTSSVEWHRCLDRHIVHVVGGR